MFTWTEIALEPKWLRTNTASNLEAFECDLAHGRCTASASEFAAYANELHGRKPVITEKYPAREFFSLQFEVLQKISIKLQSLQIYINSKQLNLHHVKSVIILLKMVAVHTSLSRTIRKILPVFLAPSTGILVVSALRQHSIDLLLHDRSIASWVPDQHKKPL